MQTLRPFFQEPQTTLTWSCLTYLDVAQFPSLKLTAILLHAYTFQCMHKMGPYFLEAKITLTLSSIGFFVIMVTS